MTTLEDIRRAQQRLEGKIRRTPLYPCESLSARCGASVWFKHEYQQVTGSFKERGACNALASLGDAQRVLGVIAASAGNHALGLAYHGLRMHVPVHVVMPRFAPMVKVNRCRALGAEVQLLGESFDEARTLAAARARDEGLTLVHGFDDPRVIAGQGTIGLEILEQEPNLEAIVVPVGGGGLIAGVATAVHALRPEVEVIGVEAEHAPTLAQARRAGAPTRVDVIPGLADGLAVSQLGDHCFAAIEGIVARSEVVTEADIASAIVALMETEKAIVEGAGAVGLAWALQRPECLQGRRVAIILSGGNIDLHLVARVIERGLVSIDRLCRVTIELQDSPGALGRVLTKIAEVGVNLLQVEHDRNFAPADIARVRVSLQLETRDREHIEELEAALTAEGLAFEFSPAR